MEDYAGENQSSPNTPPNDRNLITKPVSIGNNVWIGENVCILPGVRVGSGCIIGANTVVNKDIPGNCIAAGVPVKIVKEWNDKSKIWQRPL